MAIDRWWERALLQRWLNQRSQRHSYTQAAYTELMRLLALERENRTPGSVRGALRRPYRDW